jgi:pimeloyl-ACP methyl ester carboxylesterase
MSLAVKMAVQHPDEIEFEVNGLNFSALTWGKPGNMPILALHGWLDNAASFFRIGPLLKDYYLVAVDMAGHGKTGHRIGTSSYHCFDDIRDIFSIADYFGWDKFALLGHSRGAILGALAAGTFPERITHLGLIEGVLLEGIAPEKSPHQLAAAIKGLEYQTNKTLTLYPDIKTAITARERGMFPLSHPAAKAITERGLKNQGDGFFWSTDPRLLAPTPVKLTHEQFDSFIRHIRAPSTLIMGKKGLQASYAGYLSEVANYPFIKTHELNGGHHLHMEDDAEKVAEVLQNFFSQNSDSTQVSR